MPLEHYTHGPAPLVARIRTKLRGVGRFGALGPPSPSACFIEALECAFSNGFDIDEPPQPKTEELARLEKEGSPIELAAFRRDEGYELRQEARAMARWLGTRQAAVLGVSEAARAASAREELRRTLDAIAVEQRAEAILRADQEIKEEKAMIAARKRAAQEMETK